MSGDRTSARYDVVATTRRSWSKQQKLAIVAEIDVGGATMSEVARRHGIHSSLLFRWRKTLGSVFGLPPLAAEAAVSTTLAPRFVPVMLPAPSITPAPTREPASVAVKSGTIEIVLDGRRTVRVGADVDTTTLLRIIDALEKPR
jgi:transposase